jgi:hypothetical protein
MRVTVASSPNGSTLTTLTRRDGVVVELTGSDKKHRVPHDLAHFAAECHLRLAGGVFGSIAGGGMFAEVRVTGGRPRHDAAARSRRLLAANKRTLGLAEIMADVVHDAVEHGREPAAPAEARRLWASLGTGPFRWTDDQVTAAVRCLAELTSAYRRDGVVAADWPDSLVSPVPPPSGVERGRRGRRRPTAP